MSTEEHFSEGDDFANIYRSLLMFVAEQEQKNIALRTGRGRSLKAQCGGYSGGNKPYGYYCVDGMLMQNPEERPIVETVFREHDKNHTSLLDICEILYDGGYRTRKGKRFQPSTIRGILSNRPFYEGKYKYGDYGLGTGCTHSSTPFGGEIMEIVVSLFGVISMIGFPLSLIGFFIQLARKKPSKTVWGIIAICFVVVFVVCMFLTPSSNDVSAPETEKVTESEKQEPKTEITESEPAQSQEQVEQTEAEKFAKKNNISVGLAESLESALAGMELTDKSRVGVFHYNLSHVYDWTQIEDWAYGERYSVYMDMEHVWYIYVKDDTVVGIRDGSGNILYSAE